MTKQVSICTKCGEILKYSKDQDTWYCPACLLSSYLTIQAQREAARRYRQSDKGTTAARRYEQSDKGKTARERYLKSEKYKERRREYNTRLQESLRIAREALRSRGASVITPTEKRQLVIMGLQGLARDFKREFSHLPTKDEVRDWSEDYDIELTDTEMQRILHQ